MPIDPSTPNDEIIPDDGSMLETGEDCRSISRRRFLKRTSLIVGSVSAATWLGLRHRQEAESIWKRLADRIPQPAPEDSPVVRKKPKVIPEQADVREYRAYLAKHNLQYLSADEILSPHFKYRSGVCSGVPPKHLWRNMRNTARVANEIRHRLGVPLHTVVSAYRSPQYNDRCPGASKYSQHLINRALDLVYSCPPKVAFDMAVKLRDEGFFKGGIGLYSNFIHIDTRGRNATWGM